MRIGMRLLLGYFLIVAVAAWFVLSIFVQEIKPGVRRATEGTLIDTATLLAALARDDLKSGDPAHGQMAQAFAQLHNRPFRANISGISMERISKAALPLIFASLLALVVIIIFPDLSTFVPRMLGQM